MPSAEDTTSPGPTAFQDFSCLSFGEPLDWVLLISEDPTPNHGLELSVYSHS